MVHSKSLYRPSQRHSAGNWLRIEICSAVPLEAMALYRKTGSRPKCHDRYGIYRHAVCHRPAYVIYRNMQRYVTTIERSHQRCLKNLHHAQEQRRTLPPLPPVQPEPEEVKVAAANHPLPEVGFEPQFVPTAPFGAPAYTDRC